MKAHMMVRALLGFCLGNTALADCREHFLLGHHHQEMRAIEEPSIADLVEQAKILGIREHVSVQSLSALTRRGYLKLMIAEFYKQPELLIKLMPEQHAIVDLIKDNVALHPLIYPRRNERPDDYPDGKTYYDCRGVSSGKCSIVAIQTSRGDESEVFHHEQLHTYENVLTEMFPSAFPARHALSSSPVFLGLHQKIKWHDDYYSRSNEGLAFGWQKYFSGPPGRAYLAKVYPTVFDFIAGYELLLKTFYQKYHTVDPSGLSGIEFLYVNFKYLYPEVDLTQLEQNQSRAFEIERRLRAFSASDLDAVLKLAHQIEPDVDSDSSRAAESLNYQLQKGFERFLFDGTSGVYRRLLSQIRESSTIDAHSKSRMILTLAKSYLGSDRVAEKLSRMNEFSSAILGRFTLVDASGKEVRFPSPRDLLNLMQSDWLELLGKSGEQIFIEEIRKTQSGQNFLSDQKSRTDRAAYRLGLNTLGIQNEAHLATFVESAVFDSDIKSLTWQLKKTESTAQRELLIAAATQLFLDRTDEMPGIWVECLLEIPEIQGQSEILVVRIYATLKELEKASLIRKVDLRAKLALYLNEIDTFPAFLRPLVRAKIRTALEQSSPVKTNP